MALEEKPTTSVSETDLQLLITDQVREGKTIEYKISLPDNTHDDKKEFLNDVSSFANTDGGHLLYGIEENDGLPIALPGLSPVDIDATIQRLENLIRDGLQPRLSGVQIGIVKLGSGTVILVFRIGRSWALPHRVIVGGHDKFYARNAAGKYPLDVQQLRSLFLLSESLAERVRVFRAERLSLIASGDTPIVLFDGPKTVLHIVPLSAFTPGVSYAVGALADDVSQCPPMGRSGWSHRLNFDGLLTYSSNSEDGKCHSYLQVFRNGCIEAVDAYMLREYEGKKYIPGNYWEQHLHAAVSTYVALLERLGIQAPIVLMLSLLGVRGYTMYLPFRYRMGEPLIDRDNLVLTEILLETLKFDSPQVLRPAFDAVWNASGHRQSLSYDEKGQWKRET